MDKDRFKIAAELVDCCEEDGWPDGAGKRVKEGKFTEGNFGGTGGHKEGVADAKRDESTDKEGEKAKFFIEGGYFCSFFRFDKPAKGSAQAVRNPCRKDAAESK